MPPTYKRINKDLAICIEGNQAEFFPGDTIIGHVVRRSPMVTPRARVKIQLNGRTKSKLRRSNGNSSTEYRGRFNVIKPNHHGQLIYQGPLHVANEGEGERWPFAITIPTHVECSWVPGEMETFIPADRAAASNHTLPPSFEACSGSSEAYVEYWLSAELVSTGDRDHGTSESTLPFILKELTIEPPIIQHSKKYPHASEVISQRLLPEFADAELSTSQSLKKFFATESVPRFHFRTEVDVPTRIQLEHPEPIPLRIRVVPDYKRSRWGPHGDAEKIPQKIRLIGGELKVKQLVDIKCGGTFSTHKDSFTTKVDLSLDRVIRREMRDRTEILVPCTSEWPPLDLGERYNIKIGYQGTPWQAGSLYDRGRLSPGFTTYNIKVWHTLSYEFRLIVAGEEITLKALRALPVVILGSPADGPLGSGARGGAVDDFTAPPLNGSRTESWMKPPAEEEAPPSFAEVQEEDRKGTAWNLKVAENGDNEAEAGPSGSR